MFPDTWKTAKVKPAFKGGTQSSLDNYRPLSMLCVASKVLEKHVYLHLSNYLDKFNLITECQSGFRKIHSCQTSLTKMINKW